MTCVSESECGPKHAWKVIVWVNNNKQVFPDQSLAEFIILNGMRLIYDDMIFSWWYAGKAWDLSYPGHDGTLITLEF